MMNGVRFVEYFFRDPPITKEKAGMRTALRKLFLCLYFWYNGGECINDCPGA